MDDLMKTEDSLTRVLDFKDDKKLFVTQLECRDEFTHIKCIEGLKGIETECLSNRRANCVEKIKVITSSGLPVK